MKSVSVAVALTLCGVAWPLGAAVDTAPTNAPVSTVPASAVTDTNPPASTATTNTQGAPVPAVPAPPAETNVTAASGTNAPAHLSPSEAALRTFRVQPGFRIELVAAEPLVQSPVAGAFDDLGRLFVVEMRDYPEQRAGKLGRIRLLEDTDEDGKFDKATVFADGLQWPTAIACANGGVFVATTPDIWFFKDNDGDGVADEKRIVFSGFASDYAPYDAATLDVQALMNSFSWGLDNRIHGVAGYSGGRIAVTAGESVELHGRDFAFDPRSLFVGAEAGGEQSGLGFDSTGHKFVCSRHDHLQAIVYDDRYTVRNPYYAMPPARVSIAVDGPEPPVFRLTPGPASLGAASGVTIYRGNAWPAEYAEDAFVGDLAGNLVHRKKIFWPGIVPVGQRASNAERGEFLASTDPAFRPVQLLNTPDGTLLVIDLHREVIVHPWSLADAQRRQLDLSRGNDLGRIYRIAPAGFHPPPLNKLGHYLSADLVALLDHPNGWHRDTAARLLFERQDRRAVPLAARLLEESKSGVGRLQALYTLNGLGALQLPHVLRGLADADARVREPTLRLAEQFIPANAPPPAELASALNALTADPAARVRFQLAFTLGQLPPSVRLAPLAALARRDLGDPWMQAGVLDSLAEGADEMFVHLTADPALLGSVPGQEFSMQLATMVGVRNSPVEVERVLGAIRNQNNDTAKLALLRALNDGLQKSGSSWRALERSNNLLTVRTLLTTLLTVPQASQAQFLQAIQLAGAGDYAEAAGNLLPILDARPPPVVQAAVLLALGRFRGTQVATDLLSRWRTLPAGLRSELVEMLLTRPERMTALLSAIERGFIPPAELTVAQLQRLRDWPDPMLRPRIAAAIGQLVNQNRDQVLISFASVLRARASAAHGQVVFRARCAECHRLAGEGVGVGPDLAGARGAGKLWLLTNILAPNRHVAPAFANHAVTLTTGEMLQGLIVSENPASVLLRRPGGVDAQLLRRNIGSIDNLRVSLMPEGLEAGLNLQDVADLLEFITSAR